jgi:ribosome-binding ATPase YchF (GTP1/OBG family)
MTPSPLVALVGNPNAGKSALFNALTGARQKVGNYPGVTVERKSGASSCPMAVRSSWSICPAPTASIPPAPTRR